MQGGEKQGKVSKLSKGEVLMLNIGSMCTGARVVAVSCLITYSSPHCLTDAFSYPLILCANLISLM